MNVAGERLIGKRIADTAEIHEEILGPRRPVRTEQAEKIQLVLDAGAHRKSGLAVRERCVAGRRLRDAFLDFSKGAAAGRIKQRWSDRVAQPAAYRAEPGELLIDSGRVRADAQVHAGQISAAGAALEIGVDTQHPASELPIVPDDTAAVETARRQKERLRVCPRDDERAVIAPYPVTERAADKQTGPIVGRPDASRLIWTKAVIEAAAENLLLVLHCEGAGCRRTDAGTAEIEVEVLSLGRPIAAERRLDAGAPGPTGLGRGRDRGTGDAAKRGCDPGFHPPISCSAGHVGQHGAVRQSDARPRRAEPVQLLIDHGGRSSEAVQQTGARV